MAAGGRRLAGMSRRRRTPCRGGIYHVVQRGNRRQAIYETDQDRRLFLEMLADTLPRFGFRYHGYCLMGNHYHLMVETPNANLGKGMHWLNGVYAARFNATHEVDGHLFQDRYWASPVAAPRPSSRWPATSPPIHSGSASAIAPSCGRGRPTRWRSASRRARRTSPST